MNIAIYKPYKPILFDDEKDTSSWSREIVNLIKIFASHGHKIIILSKTDYDYNKHHIENVGIGNVNDAKQFNFDILFVSNGVFDRDQLTEDLLLDKVNAKNNVLIGTDLTLLENYHDYKKYDVVLTQTKYQPHKNWHYGHLEKLFAYGEEVNKNSPDTRKHKAIFIGHERDRYDDIKEFVIRPDVDWYGKSPTLDTRNMATKSQVIDMLGKYKFNIIIADPMYYLYGFITQRYYEGCLHGCINLVIDKYDKFNICLTDDDPRRIKNYEDLHYLIKNLSNKELCRLQERQVEELKPYINGNKIYKHIMELIGE